MCNPIKCASMYRSFCWKSAYPQSAVNVMDQKTRLWSWWLSMIQQRCFLAHCSYCSKMSCCNREKLAGAAATQVSYIEGSHCVLRHIVLISTGVAADDLGHCSFRSQGIKRNVSALFLNQCVACGTTLTLCLSIRAPLSISTHNCECRVLEMHRLITLTFRGT